MLRSNGMRPAFATVGARDSRIGKRADNNAKFRMTNDDDELGNYANLPGETRRSNPNRQPPKKREEKQIEIPLSTLVTAVVILAVLVLTIIIIAGVSSSGKDIRFSDDAYALYFDSENNVCISVNGKALDATFEGEISLREAKDRSFAYIEESSGDRHNVYILNGKTMEQVNISPVNVLAYCDFTPAVVYEYGGDVYLYTEKHGEEIITSNETALKFKFAISGDGNTVVYNETDISNGNKVYMYAFTSGKISEKAAIGCYPAFDNINSVSPVSYDGSYIYCYGYTKNEAQKKLYVVDVDDNYTKTPVGEGVFGGITAMNKNGDEIIYYTVKDKENTSHIYSAKKEVSYVIANGFFRPVSIDPEIACFKTFKGAYLQSSSTQKESATYSLNNKYIPTKIASFVGTFDPRGDYFYYINEEKTLIQIDLNDKKLTANRILSDVSDYAITQKGNLYILDADSTLRYYETGENKKSPISMSVSEISMYHYSNTLYFSESDSVAIYSTKEGSSKDSVEFNKTAIKGLPEFMNPNSSHTYVTVLDEDAGLGLFYTSNGRKFKAISSDCKLSD